MLGIRSIVEHFAFIISLNNKVIGQAYVLFHLISKVSNVCHQHESDVSLFNAIAYIIAAIVWNTERRNLERANIKGHSFIYYPCVFDGDFCANTPILSNSR